MYNKCIYFKKINGILPFEFSFLLQSGCIPICSESEKDVGIFFVEKILVSALLTLKTWIVRI